MIVRSRLEFVCNSKRGIYRIECPDKETLMALMDLIQISNEAMEDLENETTA